ncbi:hypothetical protein GUJ93_ZPchr0007g5653 [Zizania palustris]|uniref:Uncharacterized protein n=1 Tax=Zizania palustris TaxID=103762 RepID=A0A8J5STL9_ZIZPA|nr:hypothetical protein GUJ93_ZPchr0007g5653 [Zizania palustris]
MQPELVVGGNDDGLPPGMHGSELGRNSCEIEIHRFFFSETTSRPPPEPRKPKTRGRRRARSHGEEPEVRNKKDKGNKGGGGATAMDTSEAAPAASTAVQATEPMDTSEGRQPSSASAALSSISRKIKKGVQIKRSQNVRKMKAVARAISKNEKAEVKVLKAKIKKSRVQSAKSLYD